MRRCRKDFILAISFACALPFARSAVAQSIFTCPVEGSSLNNGQLYAFSHRTMIPVNSVAELAAFRQSRSSLYFVVKVDQGERKGAIVVKSARFFVPSDDRASLDNVRLKRDSDASVCSQKSGYSETYRGSVSGKSYDNYHDYGHDLGEALEEPQDGIRPVDELSRFHINYLVTNYRTSKQICSRTDDKKGVDGVHEARSNRSQFSFVTDVVDYGISSVTATWISSLFGAATAYADAGGLRARKVEIRPYETSSGIACIPITLRRRMDVHVLRINDLDRRAKSGFDWGRVPEFRIGSTSNIR